MAMQTGLEDKPWYVSAAVGAGLAIAILFGIKLLQIDKINQEREGLERDLSGLEQQIQEGRAAQKSLPQFREEVRRLELELQKYLRILPSQRDTQGLLRRLRSLTERSGIRLIQFQPKQKVREDFYYTWPISIRLEADYHNLALLFDRVSNFARIINVEGLSIRGSSSRDEPQHTIGASFDFKTFLYADPDEEMTE